jgi:hypothetical protein
MANAYGTMGYNYRNGTVVSPSDVYKQNDGVAFYYKTEEGPLAVGALICGIILLPFFLGCFIIGLVLSSRPKITYVVLANKVTGQTYNWVYNSNIDGAIKTMDYYFNIFRDPRFYQERKVFDQLITLSQTELRAFMSAHLNNLDSLYLQLGGDVKRNDTVISVM